MPTPFNKFPHIKKGKPRPVETVEVRIWKGVESWHANFTVDKKRSKTTLCGGNPKALLYQIAGEIDS